VEINRTPSEERKDRLTELASCAEERFAISRAEIVRARQLEALGFKPLDAVHIACAESGQADVMLTTDDRMIRRA
jgi:hypothetical protein